jgi:transposase InsO family protein
MTITMKDSKIKTIKDVERFLKKASKLGFKRQEQQEAYKWIQKILKRFKYLKLNKKDKGVIKQYIEKMTGYSRAQVTRLIERYICKGEIEKTKYNRNSFARLYTDEDIRLLAQIDQAHDYPNGASLKKTLKRMVDVYGRYEYSTISNISVGYIYNLRKTKVYRIQTKKYKKTKATNQVNIGEHRKPEPEGKPGYIRVDTIHQGDSEKQKGVYHINTVDEVVQFECIGAAEKITEKYLLPLLKKIIESYPYKIINFHADNGSEYINKKVAQMLNKLLIKLTKSRPRHTNDNALVETKNGAVVRKWMGYGFIKQKYADKINLFYFGCFNEYLNYHRPCAFPTKIKDRKGKIKKVYKYENYMTPYEKLKSIPNAHRYLKKGVTFKMLDKIAMRFTDNEMASLVQNERHKLFKKILFAA